MNQPVADAFDPPVAEPPPRRRPSPVVAGLLSAFAVGLGHVYAGRTARGVAWAAVPIAMLAVVSGSARVLGGGAFLLALFTLVFLPWLAALVDAVRVARGSGKERAPVWRILAMAVVLFVAARGSTFALRTFVVEAFKIPFGGLSPTLMVGDHIFVDKTRTTPKVGDINHAPPYPHAPSFPQQSARSHRQCTQCSTAVPVGAAFCGQCGGKLPQ